jgi:hypothetical protein
VRAGDMPSLDHVLQVGSRSIGTEVFCVAAWILLGTPDLAAHREILWRINHCMARATRIANDLRTSDKDATEAGINVLFVDGAALGALQGQIQADLSAAEAMLEILPRSARSAVHFTLELARHIVGVYAFRDFHQDAGGVEAGAVTR